MTADTSQPVRTVDGHVLWHVRVTSEHERTCLDCGETTTGPFCWRCSAAEDVNANSPGWRARHAARLVPTTSYLRPEEYQIGANL